MPANCDHVLCRKEDELIHVEEAKKAGIQIIKRFSGGGTVVVDHNTVFATLIMQAEAVPGLECYPRPVMKWSEGFYKNVFGPHGAFSLREHGKTACLPTSDRMCTLVESTRKQPSFWQPRRRTQPFSNLSLHADYTFGEQKFGGNAQAITKQRWLHHTSFLWDFDRDNMALLKHPSRVPDYRKVSDSIPATMTPPAALCMRVLGLHTPLTALQVSVQTPWRGLYSSACRSDIYVCKLALMSFRSALRQLCGVV